MMEYMHLNFLKLINSPFCIKNQNLLLKIQNLLHKNFYHLLSGSEFSKNVPFGGKQEKFTL